MVYTIEADVGFLCGNRTLEHWGANMDIRRRVFETNIESEKLEYIMIKTASGHYGVKMETIEKKDNGIMYLDDKQEDLTEFKAIRKLHEVNNHKGEMQLINAYSKVGVLRCQQI